MITKTCCDCREQFEVEEAKAWATRCLPCWIALQDRQGKKKVEALQAEVDYWKSRASTVDRTVETRLAEQVRELQYQITKLQLDLMTAWAKATTTGKSLPADWRDYLPRLIQLCHPDRHGGSEAANRATVWLLALKKSGR